MGWSGSASHRAIRASVCPTPLASKWLSSRAAFPGIVWVSGFLSLLCLRPPGQTPEPQSSRGYSPHMEWMGKNLSSAHRRLQSSVLNKQIRWQLQAVLDPLFSEIKNRQVFNPWVCGGGREEGCHHPCCGQDTITIPISSGSTQELAAQVLALPPSLATGVRFLGPIQWKNHLL